MELRKFFIFLKANPDEYLHDPLDGSREDERKYIRKISKDVKNYFGYLINLSFEEKPSPKTLGTMKSAINGILLDNGIELKQYTWSEINRMIGSIVAIGEKSTPTKEQLKKILDNMDLEGKAMFLMQMTSFSRIDEVLSIELNDLEMEREFPRFRVKYNNSKNTKPITKYISPEAKEYLLNYLEIRDSLIETRIKRGHNGKSETINKNLLFPMSETNAMEKWKKGVHKAGLYKKDIQTKRITMGSHSLRRYSRKQFKKHSQKWAKFFANQDTDLDKIYEQYSEEEIEEEYALGVKYLLVYKDAIETSTQIKKLQNDLETANKEIERIDTLKAVDDLKLKTYETELNRIAKIINDMEESHKALDKTEKRMKESIFNHAMSKNRSLEDKMTKDSTEQEILETITGLKGTELEKNLPEIKKGMSIVEQQKQARKEQNEREHKRQEDNFQRYKSKKLQEKK